MDWRQRLVESRRVCLFLGPFQMAWWEPLAQAKQCHREVRGVFPGCRGGLAVSLFRVRQPEPLAQVKQCQLGEPLEKFRLGAALPRRLRLAVECSLGSQS